jgi:hypothetical protein
MAEKKEEQKGHEHKEHEHKEHEHKEKKSSNSLIIPSVIGIVMLVIGFVAGILIAGGTGTTVVASDQAKTIAQTKIYNLLQGESQVTVTNVTESNGIYKFTVDVDGRKFESYMTVDGKILFPSAYTITAEDLKPVNATTTVTPPAEVPKMDKPAVELFVMSFCPYGIQAEQIMKPVFDLLGTRADFNVRFIASVGGDTIDSVQSLHGANEAKEDLRQLCIAKYYDKKTYWSYISYIAQGYSSEISVSTIDTKWKEAANATNISITKIESCLANESVALMKLDEAKANSYGVRGSESILVNGFKLSMSDYRWSSEKLKTLICSAFNTPPAECSQVLGTTGSATTTSGGCGA